MQATTDMIKVKTLANEGVKKAVGAVEMQMRRQLEELKSLDKVSLLLDGSRGRQTLGAIRARDLG